MCVDVDEPWEVFDSWPAVAKCEDCGRVARGWTEERGPDDVEEGEWSPRFVAALDMLLDDGVPDWRIDEADDELRERVDDLKWLIPPEVEVTAHICLCCVEARRWLERWCHSYWFGRYIDDIVEHWDEHEITHSFRTGKLVLAARERWRIRGRDLEPAEVAKLVDDSLAALRELVPS